MVTGVNTTKKVQKKSAFVLRLLNGANSFYDRIFRALYLTLLFALDFIMFVYSVNGKVFEGGVPNEAIVWIIGGFFAGALVLMLLLSFSGLAQNIVCALLTMALTLVFFNQFALFNIDTFIETWLQQHASALTFIGFIPSAVLVALVLGLIIFFAFGYTFPIILFCFALASSIIAGITFAEFDVKRPTDEYIVTKDFNNTAADKNGNSLIYFMLPRFPSYHFLSTVKDVNFRELRDLMIGFYAVNDFEIYPNAFVQKNNTVSNIVDIYNQVDYTSTASGIRGYAEILNDWNFIHGGLNTFGLEENRLYQELKKGGYRISTYPMPEFNFCYNKDKMDTDRCVEKAYKTVPLYDKKSTLEKNIYALLGEWVLSINSRDLNSVAKMMIDSSSLRGFKVISQNRRVSEEGSAALFDRVSGDYGRDGSGVAYMAYVDLPSDIYIYDEFCNIKPRKEWVAMKDNSLMRGGIDAKRQAYADQAKCVIGLMQMFMEDFLQDEKSKRTDVIVQGLSTIKEFSGMTAGQYENFVSDKLVSLGIRKAQSPAFLVNTVICLASDITKSLITGNDVCYSLENMKMSTNEMFNLEQNLINNAVIRGGRIINIAENYRDWYEEFKNNSPFYQAKRERMIEERVRREMQEEAEARKAYLNSGQKNKSDTPGTVPAAAEAVEEAKPDVEVKPVQDAEVAPAEVAVPVPATVKVESEAAVAAEAVSETETEAVEAAVPVPETEAAAAETEPEAVESDASADDISENETTGSITEDVSLSAAGTEQPVAVVDEPAAGETVVETVAETISDTENPAVTVDAAEITDADNVSGAEPVKEDNTGESVAENVAPEESVVTEDSVDGAEEAKQESVE